MKILHVAVANLWRKPARTAAIFLGLSVLAAMLVALSLIHYSVDNAIKISGSRLGADAMVVPSEWEDETAGVLLSGGPTEFYMLEETEDVVRSVPGVKETAPQLFVISAPLSCCTVSDTMLVGFDPMSDFTITPWLRERKGGVISENEVVVGRNIHAEPEGRIKFYGKEFLIAGKLEPTGMRYMDSSVFIPIGGIRNMIADSSELAIKTLNIADGEISAVLLKLRHDSNPEEVALRIEHALPDVKVILSSKVLSSAKENLSVPTTVLAIALVIQWIVSLMLIGVLYSMSVSEREKEIGVLRASGARSSDVFKLFLYEVMMITGAGGVVGVILGLVFVISFKNLLSVSLDAPFLLPNANMIAGVSVAALLMTAVTSSIATYRPIKRISGKSPYHSMREGG